MTIELERVVDKIYDVYWQSVFNEINKEIFSLDKEVTPFVLRSTNLRHNIVYFIEESK